MRDKLIKLVYEAVESDDISKHLTSYVDKISRKEFVENIIVIGVLPEVFSHNSSEEKCWAKLSDIFLAQALNYLGIKSEVLSARGNSADVFGKTKEYTLVADAKTFRLSRTAINQKDLKLDSLDRWRQGNNYSLLVAPLVRYPIRSSQIYSQAVSKNVTLLSYTHLQFLMYYEDNSLLSIQQLLKKVLETGNRILQNKDNASQYWNAIDQAITESVNKPIESIKEYKNLEIKKMKEIGKEEITFLEKRKSKFQNLSKKDAIELLIKSEKIESKIVSIEETINI